MPDKQKWLEMRRLEMRDMAMETARKAAEMLA